MGQLIGGLLAMALYLVPFTVLVGASVLARRIFHRRDRKNPLTRELLRSPGHTLREKLEDVRGDITVYAAVGAPMPLFIYAIWQLQSEFAGTGRSLATATFYAVAAVVFVAFLAWKIVRLVRRARDLQLGLEAELAVGQELNQLMKDGFTVFHDVPGDKQFNVDHVLVGPNGLFAVETKGRPKTLAGDGHKLRLEDGKLFFPDWVEIVPIEQARRNAEWLGKWLTSAVGEPVTAKPVLVFPGWFVERKSPSDVAVVNPTNARAFFTKAKASTLSAQQVQRIVHQLDARCRDVEPRSYRDIKVE